MAAEITARRTAATTEYKRARPTDRRSAELVEGTPVRVDNLCFAATILLTFSRKKTTIRESYVPSPSMRLLAVSYDLAVDDALGHRP